MGTFTLRIEGETDELRLVPLPEGRHRLGRAEDLELRVEEPRASREHLEIEVGPREVRLRDLDSTNGTFIGERRILSAKLEPGERFRIGRTHFTLIEEASAPAVRLRRRRPVWSTVATLLGPAVVLLILAEIGLSELASSRDREVERAGQRAEAALLGIERLEFERARSIADPERALAAISGFIDTHPRTPFRSEAEQARDEIRSRVQEIRDIRSRLAVLSDAFERDELTFSEYQDELEMLLTTHGREPEIAAVIRAGLAKVRGRERETFGKQVAGAVSTMRGFAEKGMFGRAVRSIEAFAEGSPEIAAMFSEEIRAAESEVLTRGETAYREVLEVAGKLAEEGKPEEAALLLRQEETRFSGTRFGLLLLLNAGLYVSRPESARAPEPPDQVSLRRSYHLLAREAEEMAGAGLFRQASEKYESMLETVNLPAVREEFRTRAAELAGLASLIDSVTHQIAERGTAFGTIQLGGRRYSVQGYEDGALLLKGGGGEIRRPWADLRPEEALAVIRKARLPTESRLLVAVFCAEMNLFEAFDEEIVADLGREELREEAGRLFARKEGMSYPEGGFVAYNGRVLTRTEYAEEVHRERVASLRDRQVEILRRVEEHAVFKKLAKLRDLRRDLDKARAHALELIFDEVKYFYPYRDRMKEYAPVQQEVDVRVAAVREIWENPARVTLKADGSLTALLKEAEKVKAELAALGADDREFERALDDLTVYLDRTLTVQTYFHDRAELVMLEESRRIMESNAAMETVATDPERKQVEITNLYRMMMGRRALDIDDRLVKSARGHSEEMAREGYFGHFSPHPERRTPQQRMKLEGYTGSGMSENCHMGSGSPEGAHNGWIHSSGHHRNILQKFWTEMGTGQSGRLWTQNFGRSTGSRNPRTEENR